LIKCNYCETDWFAVNEQGLRSHVWRQHKDKVVERVCDGCSQILPISLFKFNVTHNTYSYKCRKCLRKAERQKAYDDKPESRKLADLRHNLKRRFGITLEEYNAFIKANPVCALCGTDEDLVIDHCHATGVLRGRLCRSHNIALGHFKDDIEIMKKAIAYLAGSN